MKKLLAIITIAAFTACGSNQTDSPTSSKEAVDTGTMSSRAATGMGDSATRGSDSAKQTGDTSALNAAIGDSTSASGIHGQGSGSRVGGGKTGAPQGKKKQK